MNLHSLLRVELYSDTMTINEATCCEECPYFTRSKTKVQNANRREVQLHKMGAKLLSSLAVN